MHSTSVYGLKFSVLRSTGGKALATDHREILHRCLSWTPHPLHHWHQCEWRYDPSLFRDPPRMSNYVKYTVRPTGRWLFWTLGGGRDKNSLHPRQQKTFKFQCVVVEDLDVHILVTKLLRQCGGKTRHLIWELNYVLESRNRVVVRSRGSEILCSIDWV